MKQAGASGEQSAPACLPDKESMTPSRQMPQPLPEMGKPNPIYVPLGPWKIVYAILIWCFALILVFGSLYLFFIVKPYD